MVIYVADVLPRGLKSSGLRRAKAPSVKCAFSGKEEAMESLATTPAEALLAREDKRKSTQRVRQRALKTALVFWSFVGPLILGLVVFFYIPIIWSIILSFSQARATITPTSFVGLG